ncbi:ZYBA0S14-01178g1_1 [Zygosaccharomyces bailii CLIB 213]|uniref:ZYBA0S14-01178g1_1 n=1 Tax=Zygosaccharomyces bailii (strain CLIB 213 / ATCC 58445 / CBS 680 / BCRC 21525 / NBRC 1098 / NCYC 1416 / NRRL Y-2227) TaxID=1333698 RepID=A0A8J2XEE1_ZYGB2|nr:ZYBA0S14-01178g1_1 [Zygosaccharomyces bailii CLIB 213]
MPYPDSGHSGGIEEVDTHRKSDELNTQSHQEREPSGMARRRRRIPPPGIGIWLDIKDKIPLYWSDWTDSWDYRVVPAVLDTYFSNLLPALAFAQDMFDRTDHAYGVNEVLLSSAMAGIVFGVLGGQPLCMVGVTGPIAILNYTIYDIVKNWSTNYFGFMFWVCIWSMILHFILAVSNAVALLQYVTTFPCDIFGLFINVVYIQKGIQVLSRQFNSTERGKDVEGGFASVVASLVMVIFGLMFKNFNQTPFLNHTIRTFISDYSTPLSVLFWSAFTHFGGYLDVIHFQKLPITQSFHPTSSTRRNKSTWLAYHSTSAHDVFIALPFGIILTLLFYFDHNVSSLMAQKHQYKLRKPASFHYDFALLGVTTGIAGVLGIPAPNGLIPQAPMHTEALLVRDIDGNVVRCVEQRFTNTVQGLMMIGTMTRPLLVCLGQIPQAILAGLFFTMGIQGLLGNVILRRIFWLFTEDRLKDAASPLQKVSVKWLVLFLCFSLAGFAGEFAITNTIAAILFPIVLLLTVVACLLFPYIFPKDQLALLEQNVAQEFTLKNLLWDTLCGMQDVADSSISSASSSTVREDSMRAM